MLSNKNKSFYGIGRSFKKTTTRASLIEKAYLWYLIALPAAGTFGAMVLYEGTGFSLIFLLWLIFGGFAIAVYLSFMSTYIGIPSTTFGRIYIFFNSPIAVLISVFLYGGSPWETLAILFTIEVIPIYVSFAMIVLADSRHTWAQSIAICIFMILASASILAITYDIVINVLYGNTLSAILIIYSFAETCLTNFRLIRRNKVLHRKFDIGTIIAVGIMIWLGVLIISIALREASII